MKKNLCLFFLLSLLTTSYSANLLQDPGFELQVPTSWSAPWWSYGETAPETWAAKDGTNGAAFHSWSEGAYAGFGQDVAVTSQPVDMVYSFTIEGKAETNFSSASGNVFLQMEFWTGDEMRSCATNVVYSALLSQGENWATYSLRATNSDSSVNQVKVLVGGGDFDSPGGPCAVLWDNASLEVVDSSQPYLSLFGESSTYAPSTNFWTVSRNGGTIDSALTVIISNSNHNVLAIPSSVVIDAGSTSAAIAVCNFDHGSATITAQAEGYQPASLTTVVSGKNLQIFNVGSLYVGKTNEWIVFRTGPLDEAITVALGAEPSSIVSVPASATIAAGEAMGYFTIVGLSPGSVTLTATAADYQAGTIVAVVSAQTLSLTGRKQVCWRRSNEWAVARTAPYDDPLTVTIGNEHPEIVSTPASVTITASSPVAHFFVEAKKLGSSLITVSADNCTGACSRVDVSRNLIENPGFEDSNTWNYAWFSWCDASVESWAGRTGSNGVAFFGWNVGGYAGFGQNIPVPAHETSCLYRASIAGHADSGFACSNGGVRMIMEFWENAVSNVLVYAVTNDIYTDLIASGESWRTFEMEHVNEDRSITDIRLLVTGEGFAPCGPLSAAMWDDACLYEYDLGADNILLTGNDSIYMGPSNVWTISRIGTMSNAVTVYLSNSNPSVVSIPDSVTLEPHVASAEFMLEGLALGSSVITASISGDALDSKSVMVRSGTLQFSGSTTAYLDATTQCAVVRNGPAGSSISVSLTNGPFSSGSLEIMPSTVELGVGVTSASFMVIGLAPGSVDLTASAPGFDPVVSTFNVVNRQLLLSGAQTFYQGLSVPWTVTRQGPQVSSLTISLSQPAGTLVQIPLQVVIAAGSNSSTFLVEGPYVGETTILASAPEYLSTSGVVEVLQNRLTLTGADTVNAAASNRWQVTRTGPVDSSLTVDLDNTNAAAVSVPAGVDIPAGTNAAFFDVTGVSLGTALITASATAFQSASKTIEVSDNLLVDPGFENPDSWGTHWISWSSTMGVDAWAARSGSNGVAFHCWESNAWAGFAQYVDLPIGDSDKLYIFSIDIKADPDFDVSSKSIIIAMELYGETGSFSLSNNVYDTVMENRGQWTRVSVVHANTNPSMANLAVYTAAFSFEPRGGLCALMWDNARLSAQSMTVPNLELAGETNVFVSASNRWTVARAGNLNADTIVTTASDDPAIATVPSQVILHAGEASQIFWVSGISNGVTTISATAGGFNQAQLPVSVLPNSLRISGAATLVEGLSNRMTVSRSGPRSQSVQVQLTSDQPDVVALSQNSVVIEAQADSASLYIAGLSSGTATVTATASGFVPDSKANIVTNHAPSISASVDPSRLSLEWNGIPGQTYYLEEADSLTGAWTRLRGYYAGAAGVIQSDISVGTVTTKFYRLQTTITNAAVPYQ